MADSTPSRGFTPKFIESIKPRAERFELADPGTSGLVLRVMPTGVRSFRWYVRSLGLVVTIGPWSMEPAAGHVTLAQAREWLAKLKAARTGGPGKLDEVRVELTAFLAEVPVATPSGPPASEVIDEFFKRRLAPHRKRPDDARHFLDRDIIPALGHIPMAWFDSDPKAARRLCADIVGKVVDRDAPVHAGKVLGMLKQFFRYCEARGYVDRSPAAALEALDLGVENNKRDRWLTAEEVPLFWAALDEAEPVQAVKRKDYRTGKTQTFKQHVRALTPATRAGLRLLLLTGVRSGELLLAEWDEVDFKAATWTVPVAHQKLTPKQAKGARPFVIPLPPAAIAQLKLLRVEAKKSRWVMASSDSEAGHYTEKALGRAMSRLFEGKPPMLELPGGKATPHDLRRTMRTHLGKLRVPPHITERCLNHSLGRIVSTYDQGDYIEERREALERWAAYVERLVSPSPPSVAFIGRDGA